MARLLGDKGFECPATLIERRVDQQRHRVVVRRHEQVEGDEHGRVLGRQLPHPTRRRVQPQLQILEGEPALDRDYDLAVEDKERTGRAASEPTTSGK